MSEIQAQSILLEDSNKHSAQVISESLQRGDLENALCVLSTVGIWCSHMLVKLAVLAVFVAAVIVGRVWGCWSGEPLLRPVAFKLLDKLFHFIGQVVRWRPRNLAHFAAKFGQQRPLGPFLFLPHEE